MTRPWTGLNKTLEKAKEADNRSVKYNKVVIAGVSNQWTEEDIKDGTDADYVRRICRRVEGVLKATTTVIPEQFTVQAQRPLLGVRGRGAG